MSLRPPRISERPLAPVSARLRRLARRSLGRRFGHDHRVSRVRIGGRDFKRIRFSDTADARRAADALVHFAGAPILPELVARFDRDLLVEFVAGTRLERFEPGDAPALAAFYAGIHAGGSEEVALEASGEAARADRDRAFLEGIGILDAALARQIRSALEATAPDRVRMGWDFTDAVPKNFVRSGDALLGIDVGALEPRGLVGIGIAKALERGGPDFRAPFLAALRDADAPLSPAALPFVELAFQLRWLKNRCLEGSRLDISSLKRLARAADTHPRSGAKAGPQA